MRVLRSTIASGVVAVLAAVPVFVTASAASATTTCTGDVCVIDNTVDTPLGPVTVTVSSANVVTVYLAATTPTVVIGVPFTFPEIPVAGCPGGCTRTTINTAVGVVNIDTISFPPGPPGHIARPSLAIISYLPPGPPCRVRTLGTTVTFTPIYPPGPPS
jgi:hypothetical protein